MLNELRKTWKECKDVAKEEWRKSFDNKNIKDYIKSKPEYNQIKYSINKIKENNKIK